jgi:hypothetical protein
MARILVDALSDAILRQFEVEVAENPTAAGLRVEIPAWLRTAASDTPSFGSARLPSTSTAIPPTPVLRPSSRSRLPRAPTSPRSAVARSRIPGPVSADSSDLQAPGGAGPRDGGRQSALRRRPRRSLRFLAPGCSLCLATPRPANSRRPRPLRLSGPPPSVAAQRSAAFALRAVARFETGAVPGSGLRALALPATVEGVGDAVACGCAALASVHFEGASQVRVIRGALFARPG